MTQYRPLTEEEKTLYTKSLERNKENISSLTFSLKYETLMLDEGHYHNCKEKQKFSRAKIEGMRGELEAVQLALKDAEDKLANGVPIEEE